MIHTSNLITCTYQSCGRKGSEGIRWKRCFSQTGAEAIEGAIKMAKRYDMTETARLTMRLLP